MCRVKECACARKRIFIHDKYTWHAHYVTLSTHALLGLQNRFAVSLSAHISYVGYACPPFQRGMFACIHLIPRIRTIKGGKFWNVEQRKNTWGNRRARDERGLLVDTLERWSFHCDSFLSQPWPDQRGMWTIRFLSYARIRDENDEYLAKIKASTEYELVLMYYLIN